MDEWYLFDLTPDKQELHPSKRTREELPEFLREYAKEQASNLLHNSLFHQWEMDVGGKVSGSLCSQTF